MLGQRVTGRVAPPDGVHGRSPARSPARGDRVGPYDAAVKVSTRGDYASRALLSLALHARRAQARRRCATSPSAPGLPQPYLEQILLALKGAGLVRSKRGVGGGYVLARDRRRRSPSAEIVSAVDGPIAVGDFGEPHQNGACDHEGQCVLLAVWADVGEHMRQHLDAFTLADMRRHGPRRAPWPAARPELAPTESG